MVLVDGMVGGVFLPLPSREPHTEQCNKITPTVTSSPRPAGLRSVHVLGRPALRSAGHQDHLSIAGGRHMQIGPLLFSHDVHVLPSLGAVRRRVVHCCHPRARRAHGSSCNEHGNSGRHRRALGHGPLAYTRGSASAARAAA